MAKLVDLGGGPVNPTEREIVALLKAQLPNGWSVIPNASLPDRRTGHAYEYDAIVVGPHAVYVVEMKGWRGTIRQLGQSDWQLDGGRVERNPLPLTDQKARVLASYLKQAELGGRRAPYVQACLVCGSDATTLEVYGMDARRCLRPSELVPYLLDPSQLSSRSEAVDARPVHDALVRAIVGSLEARRQLGRRYGSYVTTSLQERDETRAVWLGKHALLEDGRIVRVRAWYLSAYEYTDAQRRDERDRLMRAAQALARVGDHPRVATLRDFGEHDGEFYEVTDWSEHGTLQTAFVRGIAGRMPPAQRVSVIRDVAEALRAAHEHGVFHRALSPEAILLGADGHARLTGFDLAFVEGADRSVYGQSPHPHAQFLPPELKSAADYEVFDNSDLYALARVVRLVFGHGLPAPVAGLIERCLADEPADRPENPAAFLRAIDAIGVLDALPEPARPRRLGPGDVIDGVNTVLAEIGRGAGAAVYRVANEPLGAELALKLVVDPPDGYDAAAEFRLLRAVSSPHVPRAHWLGRVTRAGGATLPYLLLDLADGERLSDRIRRGPVSVDHALGWTDDLLDALSALHAAGATGVLHRDVKADNVVVGPQGAVLVDFGSARERTDAGAAPEGSLRTTPPDLASTGWEPQADVFAVACVAYEVLTGHPPWSGAPSAEPPPLAIGLRPDVPRRVAEVLTRALAPRAADRFTDAAALRAALTQARVEPVPMPGGKPATPRTTLAAAVVEAGAAVWTARRVQALTRHPSLIVPLAQALLECVVPPADDSPEAARDALLASEARAAAVEAPLSEAMPRLYDTLIAGLTPVAVDASEDDLPPSGPPRIGDHDRVLELDALHFTEWAAVRKTAEDLGWGCVAWAWSAAPDAEIGAAIAGANAHPRRLDTGDRATVDLGTMIQTRRRSIEKLVAEFLETGRPTWLGSTAGLVYLGHGLRRDVGDGLGDAGDAARAAWAAAFPEGRSAAAGSALPCRVRHPVRETGGRRYPIGRLAWPDAPGTPWLQRGGLSLPERVLLVFHLAPAP